MKRMAMLPERLDRYQAKAKSILLENSELLIYGPRDSGKAHYIRHQVMELLLEGKNVLFVAKNKQSLQSLTSFFRSLGMAENLLYFNPESIPDPELKKELLQGLKSSKEEFAFIEFERTLLEIDALQKKVSKYYKMLNSTTLYGKSWHELLVLQAFDKHSSSLLHYNHLLPPTGYRFEQEEFETLLHAVKKAYSLVEQDQAFTDQLFRSEVYESASADEAWKRIALWIADSRKKIGGLLLSLNKYLEALAKKERKHFLAEIGKLKEELEKIDLEAHKLKRSTDLLHSMEKRRLSSSLKTLQKDNKTSLQHLRERVNTCLDQIRTGEKSIFGSLNRPALGAQESLESLQEMLNILLKQIDEVGSLMVLHVRQKLDALNTNQANDANLVKLDKEVDQLYQWLKESNLVAQNFENTAFSVNKKLVQLKELLASFNYFESREGNFKRYFSWNVFYFSQEDRVRKLIDALLIIRPLDWLSFFRNWYLQNALQFNKNLFAKEVDSELKELNNAWHKMEMAIPDYFKNRKAKYFLDLAEDKSRKSLMTDIKKTLSNKKSELSWGELFSKYPDFILANYPLMLTEAKNLEQLSSKEWDLIVLKELFDDKSQGEHGALINKLGRKRLWSQTVEKGQEWKEDDGINTQALQGLHQQNIIPLVDMNHTEKLYAARNLAYLVEDINPDVSVYRMGEYIFFSCLSSPLNQVMEQLLDKRGVKKMRVLESPFHLLVENLLEVNLKQLLITQDGLINNDRFDRIAWELFVQERFRKAGVNVLDFKSESLLSNPVQALIRFTELHFPTRTVSSGKQDQNLDSSD